MPLFILLVGLLLVATGINGTTGTLFSLLKSEFTGRNSFVPWAASIVALGSIGYIPGAKAIANSLLALLFVILFLTKDGFFDQLSAAIDVGLGSGSPGDVANATGIDLSSFANGAQGFAKFLEDLGGRAVSSVIQQPTTI